MLLLLLSSFLLEEEFDDVVVEIKEGNLNPATLASVECVAARYDKQFNAASVETSFEISAPPVESTDQNELTTPSNKSLIDLEEGKQKCIGGGGV